MDTVRSDPGRIAEISPLFYCYTVRFRYAKCTIVPTVPHTFIPSVRDLGFKYKQLQILLAFASMGFTI